MRLTGVRKLRCGKAAIRTEIMVIVCFEFRSWVWWCMFETLREKLLAFYNLHALVCLLLLLVASKHVNGIFRISI
jgi:hypothetical protein